MKLLAPLAFALLLSAPAAAAPKCDYRQSPASAEMKKVEAANKDSTPWGALFALRKLTASEPKNARAWILRSDAEIDLREYDAALESTDKALALDPCDDSARLRHGFIEERRGRPDLAYADYSALIEKNPQEPIARGYRGDVLLNAAQFTDALADYDVALKYGRPSVDLLLNRGGAYQELGRFKEAVADYERILAVEPENIEALAARGYTRFFLQDFAGAAADLKSAAEFNDNALAWRFISQSRAGVATALDEFTAAAQKQSAWMQTVAAHFKNDKPDDELAKSVDYPPQRCAALFYLGEMALVRTQKDRARALFLRAADECPKDPRTTQGSLREYVAATEELKRMK